MSRDNCPADPAGGLASCLHRLISPHSPCGTFVCPAWGLAPRPSLQLVCYRGHGLAGQPCLPHGAPGTVLSAQGLPTAEDVRGPGCPTSQETAGCPAPCQRVGTWHGDPGHWAGLPGGSLLPCPAHSETFSAWPLSSQYQEWPCYCCVCQEAMALISWSLSPCFLGLSIPRYLSKN